VSLESLIPCGEQLLVRRDPPELRCGELVIPETSTLGVTTSGVIVKVGPRAHGFTEGDRVIFGILAGRALAMEGVSSEEEYRLLPASDVQCWIRNRPGQTTITHRDGALTNYRPGDARHAPA
jgi:NADPH:quinone reductase-like Zn-dependent oxidoreductase